MLGMTGPMPGCPVDEKCLKWAHKYLKDCVCNIRDEISLALGLVSVFSWGVAEVPQIITNFKEKSTEGVSLAFLMTWVVGDIFNLAGCYLEPATLPTQFYMAALYTLTTVILVGQTVYYDYMYIHPKLKYEPIEEGKPSKPADVEALAPTPTPTPRPIRARGPSAEDLYYTSARSLASSHTPTVGSFLVGSGSFHSHHGHGFLRPSYGSDTYHAHEHATGHDQHESVSRSSSVPVTSASSVLKTAAASVLLVGTVGLSTNVLAGGSIGLPQAGQFIRAGRSLLQTIDGSRTGNFPSFLRRPKGFLGEASEGPWGEISGWLMAAIYMGGRLPQIVLNIRRGTVEGLNPLMFIFALVGNATYVASILVRSLEWGQIKPNMPWLVDAGVCVLLDTFIICQFIYFSTAANEVDSEEEEEKKGSYEAIRTPS